MKTQYLMHRGGGKIHEVIGYGHANNGTKRKPQWYWFVTCKVEWDDKNGAISTHDVLPAYICFDGEIGVPEWDAAMKGLNDYLLQVGAFDKEGRWTPHAVEHAKA